MNAIMTIIRFGKRLGCTLAVLGLFCTSAGPALAATFGSNVAQYAGGKVEDGANYLGQQAETDVTTAKQMATTPASIPSIQASPRDLANEARANAIDAASATGAATNDVVARSGNAYNAVNPLGWRRSNPPAPTSPNDAAVNAEAAEMSK
jgi:hypothetical protein